MGLSLAIDLGGTKTAAGLVRASEGGGCSSEVLKWTCWPSFSRENQKISSTGELQVWLDRLFQKLQFFLENDFEQLESFCIASPGKFIKGKIIPNTCPLLGAAFDNFSFKDFFSQRLPSSVDIFVFNDALAQMLYGLFLYQLEQKAVSVTEEAQRFSYIGIGTGLGGGFLRLLQAEKLQVQFFTDGHIGDVVLPGNRIAERDALSGDYIYRSLGFSAEEFSKKIEQGSLSISESYFLDSLGKSLGELIEIFFLGRVEKARKETFWTKEELGQVKGVTHYLIGGSIGTRGALSRELMDRAKAYLDQRGLSHLNLFQIPGDCAKNSLMGASFFRNCVYRGPEFFG